MAYEVGSKKTDGFTITKIDAEGDFMFFRFTYVDEDIVITGTVEHDWFAGQINKSTVFKSIKDLIKLKLSKI
jgi:hypothetical protein